MRLALASLLVLLTAGGVRAQDVVHVHESACTLYDVGGAAVAGPPISLDAGAARRPGAPLVTTRTEGFAATFEVTYDGFTPEAQAAFQRAVDIWAAHLTSDVTIRVDARFAELDDGVLGAAGPRGLYTDFAGAPQPATYYPTALAEALSGVTFNGTSADLGATFNSGRSDFYFGVDGLPPPNQFDFVTIVLHELGHGLGFIGSGEVDDGQDEAECTGVDGEGCWGFYQFTSGLRDTGIPLIFDRFLEDAAGTSFLNTAVYPNPSARLGDLLQSGPNRGSPEPDRDLFADSPSIRAVFGAPAPIWAPSDFEPGSSFSHWDEVLITRGTSAALMTPNAARGEAYQDPGTLTCAYFRDMGWPLGAGCSALVGSGEFPDIAASPDALDFGDVGVGRSAQRAVTVTNDGDAPLSVSEVTLGGSGDFSLAVPSEPFTVGVGASVDVDVVFAPSSLRARAAVLRVFSDDLDEGTLEVRISGQGVEATGGTPAEADPEGLGFVGPAEVVVAPNPFRSQAAVTVRVREGQDVSVAVFDVLGRRVATLHDGPVGPGEALALTLGGGRLAPGAYVVRAAGAGFVVSAPVVTTR